MDLTAIERLKKEWTGRHVIVSGANPRLARFAGRTGTVITINMNGLALVQFERDVDICRYDIPLAALRETSSSSPRTQASDKEMASQTLASKPSSTVDAKPTPKASGVSILELARRQGAAK
jgi:hypothetical protein